ncbi:glycosyltransferase family 2 protein [Ensifer sp. ENS09]|nr:glycosyltransferase family 2 protein [Ensifer sp. ENS09]
MGRISLSLQVASLPTISILMPVYRPNIAHFIQAVTSVLRQTYPYWELCIVDDGSSDARIGKILDQYATLDSRIKVQRRSENGHISVATNDAFLLSSGDWVGTLDHDDQLAPRALEAVAAAIISRPDAQIVYSDEDKIDNKGARYQPYFKPQFSPELLQSQNYFNHLTVHRASNIRSVGGWRQGFEGAQDYDLNLRIVEQIRGVGIIHIPLVLYHWRAVKGSTAFSTGAKSYALSAGQKAVQEHLDRRHIKAIVQPIPKQIAYRTRYLCAEQPRVSIIIPTKDKVHILRNCIESIRTKTSYENYEIIIADNNSELSETLKYFDELKGVAIVRKCDVEFNYSAINNMCVANCEGEFVCLLNNDIEVKSPNWLSEMVALACQDGVGCVGAKLLYSDDSIQHAGVVTGIGGVAGHGHKYVSNKRSGYFCKLKLVSNVSAVTGACLVVRKKTYFDVGGLDEDNLAVAFNDVDFCLRVSEFGLRNVLTPFAELYHLESYSRGLDNTPEKSVRFLKEIRYMQRRWGERLLNDPYYSPNLTLEREDYSLRFPPQL